MWSNGIGTAFVSKKLRKLPSGWGLCRQIPIISGGWGLRLQISVCDTFELYSTLLYSNTSPTLDIFAFNYWLKPSPIKEFLVTCQHQAAASDLRFYDIFAPTKNSSFEVSDDVIASDLWFGPPPIKNSGYAYDRKEWKRLCANFKIANAT